MITTEGSDNRRVICQLNLIVRIWWVKSLEKRDGRVKDDVAFDSSFYEGFDLLGVYKEGVYITNVGGRGGIQVCGAEEGAELERLCLGGRSCEVKGSVPLYGVGGLLTSPRAVVSVEEPA